MKILVTGGAGFIGSNFLNMLLSEDSPEFNVVNVDLLTYAGNLENLTAVEADPRYSFVKADISDPNSMRNLFEEYTPDTVVHFAAESHVDRSIEDASPFIRTNVMGTQVLLDYSMKYNIGRFLHVSTDEVYGSLREDEPAFTETHIISPNSPYAASKAASDHLVLAYHRTHGLDCVVTRCSNNYGPFQFPEKLIPLMIHNAMSDKELPVYGDGRNIRDWIHVDDHCRALLSVLNQGRPGAVYNIGGNAEVRNIEVVKEILRLLDKPESLINFVKDRPGHDHRYAMDISRISSELNWGPDMDFIGGLLSTVKWYQENQEWARRVISKEYQEYYERTYGNR
jgi:dTDP-glucose 4,6-dehydratase